MNPYGQRRVLSSPPPSVKNGSLKWYGVGLWTLQGGESGMKLVLGVPRGIHHSHRNLRVRLGVRLEVIVTNVRNRWFISPI